MSTPILKTKLYTPKNQDDFIFRHRLVDLFNQGINKKVVLVTGPAGFGKTTLLIQCIHQCNWPNAWLSLDEGDNDQNRLLTYLVSALQKVDADLCSGISEILNSSMKPDIDLIITGMINHISSSSQQIVLVLDDYHLITNPKIQDMFVFLIENMPDQLHLVIAGRAYPPWPIARLRANQEIVEIGTKYLRFSLDEVTCYLNDYRKLDLSPANVYALEKRTEGWVAGLQMAALSMQGKENIQVFIDDFTGNYRYVMEYLVEEVLELLTVDIREFLIKTSFLESMNCALCDFLLERNDSEKMISNIEKANLFLIPLDDQRQWFRYHQLFRDLLRNRLNKEYHDSQSRLHRKASEWFFKQGDLQTGIKYALAISDFHGAADIIEKKAVTFIRSGNLTSIQKTIDTIPENEFINRPWLAFTKAWTYANSGNAAISHKYLLLAQDGVCQISDKTNAEHLEGQIASVQCYLALFDAQFTESAEYGYEALDLLPESNYTDRILTISTLASSLRLGGRLAEAHQLLQEAVKLSENYEKNYSTIKLLSTQALIEISQAKLKDAIYSLEKAIQLAQTLDLRDPPYIGHVHIRLADVYSRMNETDIALRHLRKGLEIAEKWGHVRTLWQGYLSLSLLLHKIGDLEGSTKAAKKTAQLMNQVSAKLTDDATAILQAEIWRDEGEFQLLGRWLEERNITINFESIPFNRIDEYEFLVDYLLACNKERDALTVLSKTLAVAEGTGATAIVISHLLYSARAYQALGQADKAEKELARAITLGEESGFKAVFIKHSAIFEGLLRKLLSQGLAIDFIQEVLSEIKKQTSYSPLFPQFDLDPLSDREMVVLRMLTTDLSTNKMAEELFISVNTVRSHIKNIYSKLDVHGRYEAISKAKELNLL